MPPVWLLGGPPGIGKAAFAARVATFMLADGDRAVMAGANTLDLPADHLILPLIASGAHGEWHRLERLPMDEKGKDGKLARNITVDQVRALIGKMRTKPVASRWRVVIVDSIDDCERGAANALLKTLEEPPDNTLFLLVSHAPSRLLPTIRSRCRQLRFAALADEDVHRIVAAQLPDASREELAELVRLGAGSPGRALAFAGAGIAATASRLAAIAATGDKDNRIRADLARDLSTSAARPRYQAMLEQASRLAAEHSRAASAERLPAALATYDRINDIRRFALSASEDPATVTFAVGTALATLAP
jgi:DNA polymerase-3 subunit delta'